MEDQPLLYITHDMQIKLISMHVTKEKMQQREQ